MRTVSVTVYQFDELPSETAKENARNWYRQGVFDFEWWNSTYEDAANIGLQIDEFDLDRNKRVKGRWTTGPKGLHPASGIASANLILKEHGDSCETYKDAAAFLKSVAELDENAEDFEDKLDDLDTEFLKTLCADYAQLLQNESDYMQEDSQIDDNIRANQYEFDENGKRFVVKNGGAK